ncbi:Nramp family divalent metal transporter [Amorphus sp. 3PC139-8]|uniref:Nramp family divalent metal transporter n=1 Tax=Amorphus sp. 3PC139-8 TaxID=2735676 RepID=UPI00345D7E18
MRRPAWWRFFGPAFIISIGYFDPGNWATDLQAGSQFGYTLLWVLSLSCLIGALVQNLCSKLGIATGKDLAQHCAERFPPWAAKILFVSAVLSMMATDLAEIIGVAVALHLLFAIPLWMGAIITAVDVFLILLLNRWSFRAIETVFLTFLTSVSLMYVIELFMSDPDYEAVVRDSVLPSADIMDASALFIAVGIIGATIMPHNLYLHSNLAISRVRENLAKPRTLYRWSLWDTNISLTFAWFVNAAILVVAAAVFNPIYMKTGTVIASFDDAYKTLVPILSQGAGLIFAIALLVAGVASSTSATLAGQVVFEGFLKMPNVSPFLIRVGTRTVTMAPALIAIFLNAPPVEILVWSQVVLSLQLPFAMLPLVIFTDDKKTMGDFANRAWIRLLLWPVTVILLILNLVVLGQTIGWIPSG